MRAPRSPREINVAIRILTRVHGAEVNLDAPGLRAVWHQGGSGVDLISYVDRAGHVVRQEFTLFHDHFVWTSERGLRTGQVGDETGAGGVKASPEVTFDREISAERVGRANAALTAYVGDDRYIVHLKQLMAMMRMGLQSHEEPTITSVYEEVTAPPPPLARVRRTVLLASLIALTTLSIVLALLLR